MQHPDIILKKSHISGRGLFAKKKIPQGTIVWRLKDDRVYTFDQFAAFSKRYQKILRKHGYESGNKIVYCDGISKYWNHSCEPNTAPCVSTDMEMDIAIRDIDKGEEVTYDYGIYIEKLGGFSCMCNSPKCRGTILRLSPYSKIIKNLYVLSKNSEKFTQFVKQPLLTKSEITYFQDKIRYNLS